MEKKSIKKKVINFLRESAKIVAVLAICAFIGIFYAIGERKGSPERYAEKYFTYYVTNNYKEMYKMIDCKESDFISFDNFKGKCEGEKIYGSMTDYSISSPTKNGDSVTFVVSYYLNEASTPNTYTITLNKQKKNTYLFFNTWKVSIKRILVDDFEVSIPAGAKGKLDGIDLTPYHKGASEDKTLDIYSIKRIFTGDHTLSVSDDSRGSISKTEYISRDNKSMKLTISDFAMDSDERRDIESYSRFVVTSLYEYALDGVSGYDAVANLFAPAEATQANAKTCFEQLKAAIEKPDGASLRKIDIQSMESGLQYFQYPDKAVVKVNYSYTFNARTGNSILGGLVNYYDGQGNDSVVINFERLDGAWKITAIDMKCINYDKQ